MIKKTYKDILEINTTVNNLYAEYPELAQTKFGYAYKRFSEKNLKPIFDEFNEALALVQIEHALTDEKTKALILNKDSARGFDYDKNGLREVIKAERKLLEDWAVKAYDLEPYITTEIPDQLTEDHIELFKGIIIAEVTE